jgi:hypothetical protein
VADLLILMTMKSRSLLASTFSMLSMMQPLILQNPSLSSHLRHMDWLRVVVLVVLELLLNRDNLHNDAVQTANQLVDPVDRQPQILHQATMSKYYNQ